MQARRLFSVFLVLALFLSPVALATEGMTFSRYVIEYVATDPASGEQDIRQAFEGVDFVVEYNDPDQMHLWFRVLPDGVLADNPLTQVHVVAEYYSGANMVRFVYFDPVNGGNEWFDMSGSNTMPQSTSLKNEETGEVAAGNTITVSPYFPDYGSGSLPDPSDPNAGGDPNASDPNSSNDSGNNDGQQSQALPTDRLSDYGRVSGSGIALYSYPYDQQVGTLLSDTVVYFDPTDPNGQILDADGRLWCRVTIVDGSQSPQTGYVMLDAFQFIPQAEADAHIASVTITPPPQQQMPGGELSDLLRVTQPGAALYSGPNGSVVGGLAEQSVITFLNEASAPTVHDDDGNLWLFVEVNGQRGYVMLNDVNVLTPAQKQEYLDSLKPKAQEMVSHDSDYADVLYDETTLFDAQGQPISMLDGGTVVKYLSDRQDNYFINEATGDRYIAVEMADGSIGYLRMDAVSFKSKDAETAYLDSIKTPEPTMVTDAPTATPTDTPTEPAKQTEETTPIASPGLGDYSRYAWSTANNVNVRQTPNGESVVTQIHKNHVVLVRGEVKASDDVLWYDIELSDTRVGFVRSDFLKLMTVEEEQAYIDSLKTSPPTNTATPTPTPPLPQVSGYMRTNVQNAPVMNWYNVGALPLTALPAYTVVYVWGQVYDNAGNIWSQVTYDSNKSGYILSTYLTAMTPSQIEAYFKAQVTPTPPPQATQDPSSSYSGYAMLTSNNVNFRSSASATGSVITRLNRGTLVRVLGQTVADGYTWYRCESGGTVGYLRADMISMLTIREYELLVTAPSYSQNGNIITPTASVNSGSSLGATWAPQSTGASTITFVTLPPVSTLPPDASPPVDPSEDPSLSPSPSDGAGLLTSPTSDPAATLPPPSADPTFETQPSGGFSATGLLLAMGTVLILGAGGFYGYTVYNKARRKQTQQNAAASQKEVDSTGAKPAVRRPVPPTQTGAAAGTGLAAGAAASQQRPGTPANGQPGQQARPGTPVNAQSGQQQRPGTPVNAQSGQQQRPGTPVSGQAGAQRPAPGQVNPYARPQSATPTQAVSSTMPRAQVDGKPVDGRPIAGAGPVAPPGGTTPNGATPGGTTPNGATPTASPINNPYARPQGAARQTPPGIPQTPPGTPQSPIAGTPSASGARTAAAPGQNGQTRAQYSPYAPPMDGSQRLPVAPPATQAEAEAEPPTGTTRRRRHRVEDPANVPSEE